MTGAWSGRLPPTTPQSPPPPPPPPLASQCVHDCDTRLSEEDQDRLIQLVAEHLLSA